MKVILINDHELSSGKVKRKGTILEMTEVGSEGLIKAGIARNLNFIEKIIISKKEKNNGNSKCVKR